MGKTLTAARGVISPDSPLVVELEDTLKKISAMSQSIRELADYLEQHPEALIRGKKKLRGQHNEHPLFSGFKGPASLHPCPSPDSTIIQSYLKRGLLADFS